MEIPFKGQYTRDIFFRAVRLANNSGRGSGWMRLGVLAALAAVLALTGRAYIESGQIDSTNLLRLGAAMLIMGLFFLVPPGVAYWQAYQIWKDPAVRTLISGRISDKGITYTNTSPYRTVPWERFVRVRSEHLLITLLTAQGVITVFPRSFFKQDSDWEAAKTLIQRKMLTR